MSKPMRSCIVTNNLQTMFQECLANETLDWYGVDLPNVVEVLSPRSGILWQQWHDLDLVLRLANDHLLRLEFQVGWMDQKDMDRVVANIAHLVAAHHVPVHTVVVHLQAESAPKVIELGSISLRLDHVFLASRDGRAVWTRLVERAKAPTEWTSADYLDLAFLPFMSDRINPPAERARRVATLANNLPDPYHVIATALLLSLTATFATGVLLESLREGLRMNRFLDQLKSEACQEGHEEER